MRYGKQFIILSSATLYAIVFAYVDVIFNYGFDEFLDRKNYLNYAENSTEIFLDFLSHSFGALFFNEPVFLGFMSVIHLLPLEPELIIRFLIAGSSFVAAYYSFSKSKNYVTALLIILSPQVFVNYVMSLRQGLAISVFLFGWFSKNKYLKYALIGLCPLIHTSFYLTLVLIVINKITEFSSMSKLNHFLILSLLSIAVVFGVIEVAEFLGIRQALAYADIDAFKEELGGGGFVFFGVILAIFFFQKEEIYLKYRLEVSALIVYIISYWYLPPIARTIQNHAILIFISGTRLAGISSRFIFWMLICYYLFFVLNFDNFIIGLME